MTLSDNRWHSGTLSEYPWEQEALDYLRQGLPDRDPWHVWSNVEFIAGSGALYEIDALVLSPSGVWVVEIKSDPGRMRGDHQFWHFFHDGHTETIENPVYLTNKKCKALKSVLQANRTVRGLAVPWIGPLVFLSAQGISCELEPGHRAWVCVREDLPPVKRGEISGILSALETGKIVGTDLQGGHVVRQRDVSGLVRTIEASVHATTRGRRVKDYGLGDLIDEGPGYQDRVAENPAFYGTRRRARCYMVGQGVSQEERRSIQRAAEREFAILDSIKHPGILPVKHISSGERGPVVLFEYDARAQRLDLWLASQSSLDQATALEILEQLHDAIRTAHNHSLIHRALSPRSILFTPADSPGERPVVRIFNWQTALYLRESTSKATLTGTVHVDCLVEDAAAAYMAPESIANPQEATEVADVFSLGAIAFRLFSGKAPAANHLELVQALSVQQALRLSAVCNGVPPALDDLVAASTHANPLLRWSIDEFGQQLQKVWNELTEPAVDVLTDPLQAQKGHKLRDDESRELYEVTDRLGLGATALAVRAQAPGEKTAVLKIARGPDHNAILEKEYEVLSSLHDATIVRVDRRITLAGHTTIVMQDAGESLAARLRSDGRLSFEMLQTLGEDLLHAVDYLEGQGVFHRDLKPENMGIQEARLASKKRLSLVLYDFSLVSANMQSVTVGTQQYLDPFLKLRKPAIYDTYAERYAVAVTLYEMATGTHAQWGNGLADPAADSGCELVLETGLFPASCRDDLAEFFERALHRDPASRFHNAREMLRAWTQVFENAEDVSKAGREPVDQAKAIAEATLTSPLETLGLKTRTCNALDRINVLRVQDLLRLREGDLIGVRGIGYRTKREIIALRGDLKTRFPEEKEQARPLKADILGTTLSQAKEASVDHLFERITAGAGRDAKAQQYRDSLLGLSEPKPHPKHPWPSQTEVADHFGITRATLCISWGRTREAWWRSASLKELRDDIAAILERQGGVLSAEELGEAVLAQRGSLLSDAEPRRRNALAVACAALALEERQDSPRFSLHRRAAADFVATGTELADYGAQLGQVADGIAQQWPPPGPVRTIEQLRAVKPPASGPQDPRPLFLPDRRLIALAAAASARACLAANHQQLYLEGLDGEKALRLASGSLLAVSSFKPEAIQARVRSRYPRAQLLPGRPQLDKLIEDCEISLEWSSAKQAYVRPEPVTTYVSNMSLLRTTTWGTPPRLPTPPEQQEAARCQSRLEESLAEKTFLAIQVAAHYALFAQRALLRCFRRLELVDMDEVLLTAMHEYAQKIGADWRTVLRADGANRNSSDWERLCRLVNEKMPKVQAHLLGSQKPLLIVNPGLLARYDQVGLLEKLRDESGTPKGPPGCWVLIPTSVTRAMPLIDDKPLPLIGSVQNLVLPRTWTATVLNGNGDGAMKTVPMSQSRQFPP